MSARRAAPRARCPLLQEGGRDAAKRLAWGRNLVNGRARRAAPRARFPLLQEGGRDAAKRLAWGRIP